MQLKNGKRQIVAAVGILLLLFLAMAAYLFVSAKAAIECTIVGNKPEYYADVVNQISVRCTNYGAASGSFYVILNTVGASFEVAENAAFSHLSKNSVWIPFSLSSSKTEVKAANFIVDRSQEGFSFSITVQAAEGSRIEGAGTPLSYVSYKWNNATGKFEGFAGGGVVA
jgi:hypothetical protein